MRNLICDFNKNEVQAIYPIGVILAIAICFAIYCLIMSLYIYTRKKHPSAKYSVELIFILIGMAFSVFTKLLILTDIDFGDDYAFEHNIGDYIAYSFSAIYSLVGSLQFEGLPFSFTDLPAWQTSLYYGSSIIAGLLLLSIITAKASYEIYSLTSLFFSKTINRITQKNSVYIFNSLTKDSIIFAKSIKKNDKNSVIIFAGNNVPSFSRSDPLCREIMSNSFYYYSLSSGNDTKKSVLSRLKLKACNISMLTFDMEKKIQLKKENSNLSTNSKKVFCVKKLDDSKKSENQTISDKNDGENKTNKKQETQKRICEFYFELDEEKKPNQERNTVDAFTELSYIIDEVFTLKKKSKAQNKATKLVVDKILHYLQSVTNIDELIQSAKLDDKGNKFVKNNNKTNDKTLDEIKKELSIFYLEYFHNIAGINHWIVSEHYILTFNDSNYEFYSRTLQDKLLILSTYLKGEFKKLQTSCLTSIEERFGKNEVDKYIEFLEKIMWSSKSDKKDDSLIINTLTNYLTASNQIHIVNESRLTSISLVEQRSNSIKKNAEKFNLSYEKRMLEHLGYSENNQLDYKALILGFGGNGQSSLNSLYFDSAIISDKLQINGFYADVFDKNIKDLDAIFAKNHPLYRCFTVEEGEPLSIDEAKSEYFNIDKNDNTSTANEVDQFRKKSKDLSPGRTIIKNDDITNVYGRLYPNNISELEKYMTFPLIQFHDTSCTSFEFINFFDGVTGTPTKNKTKYDIFVISFGSDRRNITIANTIIDDIRREYICNPHNKEKIQCIAVNIRDAENLDKLNWTIKDKEDEKLKNVIVFTFGAKEDLYSYEKIIDYTGQYMYSTNYESMINIAENKEVCQWAEGVNKELNGEKIDCATKENNLNILSTIVKKRAEASNDYLDCLSNQVGYLKLNNTKKEVNRISNVFGEIMRLAISKLKPEQNINALKALTLLEHEKWNRFYISEGWIYDKNKNSYAKTHDCLIPLKLVPSEKYGYDLINVAMQMTNNISNDK